ncbi:MAG TPA: high-potential iron-sulfur protein [Burkholderiales bacterium]|nr:high-potential iron-sulfur protein [Burkholderiales bacterium]
MTKETQTRRREFVKAAGAALSAIPVLLVPRWACAATNASMRAALKYQAKPQGDKSCAGCLQFVPGPSAKDLGGCKIIPGDTEISPQGYCTGWVKKA